MDAGSDRGAPETTMAAHMVHTRMHTHTHTHTRKPALARIAPTYASMATPVTPAAASTSAISGVAPGTLSWWLKAIESVSST